MADIALNDALGEFHRELFSQYGLFFVECGYGTDHCDLRNVENRLMYYALHNISAEGIMIGKVLHNPSGLKLQDVEVTGVSLVCDEQGAVLRRQAVDVMKQKVGLTYLEEIVGWFDTVKKYSLDTKDLLKAEEEAYKTISEWNTKESEMGKDVEKTESTIVKFWKNGVLYYVVDSMEISGQTITPDYYLSHRDRLEGTGMQPGVEFKDSFLDRLIFQEYILMYTGHYKKEKEEGLLKYQTEYILAGKNSDADNLDRVAQQLLFIRGAANFVSLLQDGTKKNAAKAAGTLLATVCLVPDLETFFTGFLEIMWSMAEAIYDVAQLFHGKKIPLIKQNEDWYYSLEGLLTGVFLRSWNEDSGKNDKGLTYEDYLRVLLCLEKEDLMTYRLMDIMEMDIRKTPGNEHFRMDGCADGIRAAFRFLDANNELFEVERSYGY